MGGFLGIGHSSAKTDRSQTLTSYQDLNNLFNFGFGTGKGLTGAGTSDLSGASGYWKNLMSGSRPALMQAIAPEANQVQASADASRRQQAAGGTARGGGVAGTNQQQKDSVMAQIDNALFGVRPIAAKESADVGKTELAAGYNALGLGEEAAKTNLSESVKSRPESQKINQETVQSIADFAGSILDAIPGLPGAITGILG